MKATNPFRRETPGETVLRPLDNNTTDLAPSSSDSSALATPGNWENEIDELVAATRTGAASDVSSSVLELPFSKPAERPRSKPPPPVVTPRKRASRIDPLPLSSPPADSAVVSSPAIAISTAHVKAGTPIKPSTPEQLATDFSNNLEDPPSLNETNTLGLNPFVQRTASSSDVRRSLDVSELPSLGMNSSAVGENNSRQSLDVEAFKQLMLGVHTQQGPVTGAGENTSSSSASPVSRRSVSEPIAGVPLSHQSPMTSSSGSEEQTNAEADAVSQPQQRPPPPLSRSSSNRVKPPPPKPRSRSGGKSSLSSSSTPPSQTTPSSPSTNRPLSYQEAERPLVPTRTETEKSVAPPPPPPPPLSRKHSARPRVSEGTAGTVEETKETKPQAPPPPPPIRRSKTTSSRSPAARRSERPLSISGLPPPPPPPRKQQQGQSIERNHSDESVPLQEEHDSGTTTNILVNLEALQREVDELRGKYGTVQTVGGTN